MNLLLRVTGGTGQANRIAGVVRPLRGMDSDAGGPEKIESEMEAFQVHLAADCWPTFARLSPSFGSKHRSKSCPSRALQRKCNIIPRFFQQDDYSQYSVGRQVSHSMLRPPQPSRWHTTVAVGVSSAPIPICAPRCYGLWVGGSVAVLAACLSALQALCKPFRPTPNGVCCLLLAPSRGGQRRK